MTFAKTPEGEAIHRMVDDMWTNANNNIAFALPSSVADLAAGEGNYDALCAVRRMLLAASDAEDFATKLHRKTKAVRVRHYVAGRYRDTERMAQFAEYESVLDQFIAALSSSQSETA